MPHMQHTRMMRKSRDSAALCRMVTPETGKETDAALDAA